MSLEKELKAFGFDVFIVNKKKSVESKIHSAFLKVNTFKQLILIKAEERIVGQIPKDQELKIKIEIDTDPPSVFSTEVKYLVNQARKEIEPFIKNQEVLQVWSKDFFHTIVKRIKTN